MTRLSERSGSGVHLAPLDLVAYAETAVSIQAAALATVGNREVGPAHVGAYARHAAYPGFTALGAWHGEELVGFCYAHDDAPGQWWHDQVAPALEVRGHGAWLVDAGVLVELHVRPDLHGLGIGPRMLHELTRPGGRQRLLLSTDDLPTPARRLYRRLGFADLLTGFHFPTTRRPFAIMGTELPLDQGPGETGRR
jgi:GNAT superfamily N-acetyltransferase